MVVGLRAAEFVEVEEVLPDVVGDVVEELHLVEGAVGTPLAACTVVRDDDDDRVLQLPGLLEIIEDPPDLVVRVGDETGKDLRHADEQRLLVLARGSPRAARNRVSARAARPAR